MYVPWNNGYDDPLIRIYNPRGSENYLCANAWKFPTMYPGSGSSEYHNNHVATEAPAGGHALWLAGTDFDRYEITTTHGGTAPSGIDRIGKFTSLPWDADRYWSVTMMFSTCVQEGTPRIRPMRVISGSQLIRVDVLPNSKDNGFYDLIVYNNDNPIITLPEAIHWERAEVDEFGVSHPKYYAYFCALTYDFDAKTLKIYLSGPYVQKSEDPFWIIGVEELPAAGEYTNLTFGPTSENVFNTFQFGIGHQNSDYVLGYYSEIKVWDIPLTPLQVGAELHRIITLEEEE